MPNIAVIGFGEAGQAFVAGWRTVPDNAAFGAISMFDVKSDDAAQRPSLVEACNRLGVTCSATPQEALKGKNAVFSLVTADRALEAAKNGARFVESGAFYFDCNSCSPSTKAAAAAVIDEAGGHYIDVAVMAPVHPARHQTPLLVAGAQGEIAVAVLTTLGMNARVAGNRIGEASAIKMLRSVMIKGIEALTAECMLAARRAGVEQAVLASLQASDPGINWETRSSYNLERMMVHGRRRAAEMTEVAATLRDLGVPDRMTTAAVDWQRQIADFDLDANDSALAKRADAILGRLTP